MLCIVMRGIARVCEGLPMTEGIFLSSVRGGNFSLGIVGDGKFLTSMSYTFMFGM